MNLELVEERCLKYLAETIHPLVPVNDVLNFCRRDDSLAGLSLRDLLSFLRAHELVRVVEVPSSSGAEFGPDSGAAPEPRVILKARIPSPGEMSALMLEQMERMSGALQAAVQEAEARGDTAALKRLRQALERAESLRTQIGGLS